LFCVINIKQVRSLTEYTLGYIYYGTIKKIMVGVFRVFMRFSRRLKILEMTLDTFPDTGGRWASGRLLTSVPDPFSAARTSGKLRKENLLTLNNKSGRSFVPPSALSKYPTERYKHPMGKHRACIDREYPINNKSVRSARLLFGCPAFWRGKRRTNCYSSYSRQRWRKNFGSSCQNM